MKTDVYQRITDKVVNQIESGGRPRMQHWSVGTDGARIVRSLRFNGQTYNGINVLMLWSAAEEKGYRSPTWMTFKQALEFDADVRKGELGTLVVYADKIMRTETNTETGEEAERAIPFIKGYTVFNVEVFPEKTRRFGAWLYTSWPLTTPHNDTAFELSSKRPRFSSQVNPCAILDL